MRFGKRDYRITGGRSWKCSSRNRLVNKQQAKQSRAQLSSFGGVTVDIPGFREAEVRDTWRNGIGQVNKVSVSKTETVLCMWRTLLGDWCVCVCVCVERMHMSLHVHILTAGYNYLCGILCNIYKCAYCK